MGGNDRCGFTALADDDSAMDPAHSIDDKLPVDLKSGVGFADFLVLSENFGSVRLVSVVPQPSNATLLILVVLVVIRRRINDPSLAM